MAQGTAARHLLLLTAALIAACRPAPVVEAKPVATTTTSAPELPIPAPLDAGVVAAPAPDADAPAPAPLRATKETWHLGDFDVVVSVPPPSAEKRPIVMGIHGSHDRPEDTCKRWSLAFLEWPFIVCPAGVPYKGGLAWGAPSVMADRIDRVLAELRAKYKDRIASGPIVYAGWSLGATRGPGVVALRPGLFEPVILAEVGHTKIDVNGSLASLRKGKAEHVIIACATKRCQTFEQRLVRAQGKSQTPNIELVDAGIGRGHVFDKDMALGIGGTVAKDVMNVATWAGFLNAPKEAMARGQLDEPLPDTPHEPDEEPDLVAP